MTSSARLFAIAAVISPLACGSSVEITEEPDARGGSAPSDEGTGDEAPACPNAIPAATATCPATASVLASDPAPWQLRSVAVDDDRLYWTAALPPAQDGRISAVDKAGGQVVVLADNQTNPGYLALDGSHVYWTNNSSISGAVMRVRKDGAGLEWLASSGAPFSIAVDDLTVYWTDLVDNAVYAVPKNGGVPEVIASGLNGPQGLALHEDYVYWADYGGGRVLRISKDGGPVETIASDQDLVRGVAVDCHAVYWSTHEMWDSGRLFSLELPIGSGAPQVLSDAPQNSQLVVDARFVYGSDTRKAPRGGGDSSTLSNPHFMGRGVAVDECFYYTGEDGVGALHKIPK